MYQYIAAMRGRTGCKLPYFPRCKAIILFCPAHGFMSLTILKHRTNDDRCYQNHLARPVNANCSPLTEQRLLLSTSILHPYSQNCKE